MPNLQKQIDDNYDYFVSKVPELLEEHRGKYALLKDQSIIEIYDTILDAKVTGDRFIDDGLFSIQRIEDSAVDLGYYSHVVDTSGA